MEKFEVIDLGSFEKAIVNGLSQPYCLDFIYTPEKKIILKGMKHVLDDYIIDNFPIALIYESWWNKKKPQGHWRFAPEMNLIITPKMIRAAKEIHSTRHHHQISYASGSTSQTCAYFRRIPRKWLAEYTDWNNGKLPPCPDIQPMVVIPEQITFPTIKQIKQKFKKPVPKPSAQVVLDHHRKRLAKNDGFSADSKPDSFNRTYSNEGPADRYQGYQGYQGYHQNYPEIEISQEQQTQIYKELSTKHKSLKDLSEEYNKTMELLEENVHKLKAESILSQAQDGTPVKYSRPSSFTGPIEEAAEELRKARREYNEFKKTGDLYGEMLDIRATTASRTAQKSQDLTQELLHKIEAQSAKKANKK